jgi:CheY-like chemotaxis protein
MQAMAVAGQVEAAGRRRILVVDDNADAADMMKTLLELHGHEVRVAYDGLSALATVSEFKPEIGLFDIGLPSMNGYELARRVRQDAAIPEIYLVAVTGWGQEEDRRRARASGFDAHLTKPADPEELQRLIALAGKRFDA